MYIKCIQWNVALAIDALGEAWPLKPGCETLDQKVYLFCFARVFGNLSTDTIYTSKFDKFRQVIGCGSLLLDDKSWR